MAATGEAGGEGRWLLSGGRGGNDDRREAKTGWVEWRASGAARAGWKACEGWIKSELELYTRGTEWRSGWTEHGGGKRGQLCIFRWRFDVDEGLQSRLAVCHLRISLPSQQIPLSSSHQSPPSPVTLPFFLPLPIVSQSLSHAFSGGVSCPEVTLARLPLIDSDLDRSSRRVVLAGE